MTMRLLAMLLISIVLLPPCKKDKLDGDLTPLVGTWRYVEGYRVWCFPYSGTGPYVAEDSFGSPFKMEFKEKGILRLYQTEDCTKRYRILEGTVNSQNTDHATGFSSSEIYRIQVKDKELGEEDDHWEFNTYYYVHSDTLMTRFWPKPETGYNPSPNSCFSYHNYYIKEN